MDNKINDILKELDENVDLRYLHQLKKIKPTHITGKTLNDIEKNLENIDISSRKYPKINKLKKSIDSLKKGCLKDINLTKEHQKKIRERFTEKTNQIKSKYTKETIDLTNIKKINKEDILNGINEKKNNFINRYNELSKKIKINKAKKEKKSEDNIKNNIFDPLLNLKTHIEKIKTTNIKISGFRNNKGETKSNEDTSTEIKKIDFNGLKNKKIENKKEKEDNTIKIKRKLYFSNNYIFTNKFIFNIFIIFAFLCIGLIIDKNIVENKINNGYHKLLSIKNNLGDTKYIKDTITSAKDDFTNANLLFLPFRIIPNKDVLNGYYVINGGIELTNILEKGLEIYESTNKYILENGGIENIKITNLLSNQKENFSLLVNMLYNTIVNYNNIGELPNKELNNKLNQSREKLLSGFKTLDLINKEYDIFLKILGHNSERKYLIVFQNNDEIRPTGGFIGSLATVTIKNGKVTDFSKEDVYSYEWDINKVMTVKEPAPEGLNKITETFGFRDSNYFLSFEASSNSMKSFIDKVDRHIDGIIFINQNTILDFLKYTGGIKFDDINETITQENFSLIISTLVEAKVFKVGTLGTPKQILFDFANKFTNILKEKKDYYAYFDIISKNIKSRDIVIYSFNPEENNLLWKLGLNGKINYQETMDFAYPVYTSVGGNKSDRYIELKYKKDIIQNTDCSIDTNLSIYRTHKFGKIEEKNVVDLLDKYKVTENRENLINIQGRGENRAYIRVLLPKDAKIVEKEGMNIKKYDTFTQVEYYQNTRLLESTHFDINYKLENKECKPYKYKIYKQPGIRKYSVEINKGDNNTNQENINTDYIF